MKKLLLLIAFFAVEIINAQCSNPPSIDVSGMGMDPATCDAANGGFAGLSYNNVTGGTTPYNFQWYNGSGAAIPGATSPDLGGIAAGVYQLQVTDANGCAATVIGGPANLTFTMTSIALSVQCTTSPNPATGNIPLTISFNNTSQGASNYTWNFGDGTSTTTIASPTHTFTNAGTYTVTLQGNGGSCTDTISIIVNALNNAGIINYNNQQYLLTTQYYNLLGQPIDEPNGIAIEVKTYVGGQREIRKIVVCK